MQPKKLKPKAPKTVDTIMQAGQIVDGKYRVGHLLGQGGMAAVWAGTNERTGKRVALKVILRSLATTRDAQRLVYSEALAASRVNHPNVVTVFDVIEHEGMACIVMELLDGEPLGTYISRKGCLSVSEATSLLLPAMRGVAAANAQGVVHRDLKPQNIFVCIGPDGRIVTTKVLDFGISMMMQRVVDPSAGPIPAMSMGTPAYMSPEHISGEPRIDERADVYGFGVLLYEALSGRMPFPGDPGPDLFQRILKDPAPSVTQFRPDLPPGLVRIIEAAMAKQPDHRYSDLNLMVSALEEELLPPTPVARLLTPLAGVPTFAVRDTLPGQSVVQAILRREPSSRYQETKVLFTLPQGKEKKESPTDVGSTSRGSNTKVDDANPDPAMFRETVALRVKHPTPVTAPATVVLSLAPSYWKALLGFRWVPALGTQFLVALRQRLLAVRGAWLRKALRTRHGVLVAGGVVVLGTTVWLTTPSAEHRPVPAPVSQTSPAANSLLAPPVASVPEPVPSANVPPANLPAHSPPPADPAPAPSPPPSPSPTAAPAPSKSANHARGTLLARIASRGPRERARDGSSGSGKVSQTAREVTTPAPKGGASTKSGAPRAGKLSVEDF